MKHQDIVKERKQLVLKLKTLSILSQKLPLHANIQTAALHFQERQRQRDAQKIAAFLNTHPSKNQLNSCGPGLQARMETESICTEKLPDLPKDAFKFNPECKEFHPQANPLNARPQRAQQQNGWSLWLSGTGNERPLSHTSSSLVSGLQADLYAVHTAHTVSNMSLNSFWTTLHPADALPASNVAEGVLFYFF